MLYTVLSTPSALFLYIECPWAVYIAFGGFSLGKVWKIGSKFGRMGDITHRWLCRIEVYRVKWRNSHQYSFFVGLDSEAHAPLPSHWSIFHTDIDQKSLTQRPKGDIIKINEAIYMEMHGHRSSVL